MSGHITAILNLYKRPHTLATQIHALKSQTIPPSEIIIWVNQADGVTIPQEVANDKSIHIIYSSKNTGVWGRFTAGILAHGEYICVFDDDTIPGRRWFENCMETMKTHTGLLGTVGIVFQPGTEYKQYGDRVGWPTPNSTPVQVDIVGHSWFFKREWLSAMFSRMPVWPDMFTVGEDIGFSAGLQAIGVNTYVPPHPPGELELYGSIPAFAWKYGTEACAVSWDPDVYSKFSAALAHYIKHGFVTIMNRRLIDDETQ